uniref:CEP170 C-terminal domain-containing protein n=1 Tax=Mola mola TaxID=94237 RepID=A0A3Q3WCF2_MOLML
MGENLMLASVIQLSKRIRQSVDKTDKERKWEEIESKLQEEHDSLLLKSSNKEISSIIQDLKRVERQLLVIDMMVDPNGTLDALSNLSLASPLNDQRVDPGTQQGASMLHHGAKAPSKLSPLRPEGLAPEAGAPSDQAESAERDPGLKQGS